MMTFWRKYRTARQSYCHARDELLAGCAWARVYHDQGQLAPGYCEKMEPLDRAYVQATVAFDAAQQQLLFIVFNSASVGLVFTALVIIGLAR